MKRSTVIISVAIYALFVNALSAQMTFLTKEMPVEEIIKHLEGEHNAELALHYGIEEGSRLRTIEENRIVPNDNFFVKFSERVKILRPYIPAGTNKEDSAVEKNKFIDKDVVFDMASIKIAYPTSKHQTANISFVFGGPVLLDRKHCLIVEELS